MFIAVFFYLLNKFKRKSQVLSILFGLLFKITPMASLAPCPINDIDWAAIEIERFTESVLEITRV